MSLQQVIKEIGCSECSCSGEVYIDGGDYRDGSYYKCERCKGRKSHKVMLIITGEFCDAAMWDETRIECQNGTMRNTEPFYRYGKNFLGQETRERIGNISRKCPFCFGTGKKHFVAKKIYCSHCHGKGSTQESRWEKSFFGREVKREYISICQICRGNKYEWGIDHEFSSTQISYSNL